MSLLSEYLYRQNDSQTNYDAIRYSAITYLIGVVHIAFTILFHFMGATGMAVYNVIISAFYIICGRTVQNIERYDILYTLYLIEILVHAALASVLCGWDFGFMFYTISLIPISFYIDFSISVFRKKLIYPYITSISVLVSFVIIRIITYILPPFYQSVHPFFPAVFYFLNVLVGIGAVFIFSALFAIEVNSMQLQMESEQQTLEDQASFDPLTKFLNRRSMEERLNHAHRNAIINNVTYSLIMTDIDDFKKFNDTYGHDCGDFVLQSISKLMAQQIRVKDSACRWGGEEFLLLISEDSEKVSEIAERIRSVIDKTEFNYEGKSLHVTITLGVATYFPNAKVKTLIDIADRRLYIGKSNGKNQVVISS